MAKVNQELLAMALEKIAVVPPGGDPAMAGGAPPMDPAMMGGAPGGPTPPGGPMPPPGPTPPGMDPMAAMQPAAPAAPPQPPKLKPEQMMQMIDMRLYNMQQQLTSIMNSLGVQVAPEALVLPPGSTAAPAAETALPGGPMAPPPPQGASPAGDPAAAGGMPPPGADPMAGKMAQHISLSEKAAALEILHRAMTSHDAD